MDTVAAIAAVIGVILMLFTIQFPFLKEVTFSQKAGKEKGVKDLIFTISTSLLHCQIKSVSVSGYKICLQNELFVQLGEPSKECHPYFDSSPRELEKTFSFACFPDGSSSKPPVLTVRWRRSFFSWSLKRKLR